MAYQKYTIGDVDGILQGLSGDKLILIYLSIQNIMKKYISKT